MLGLADAEMDHADPERGPPQPIVKPAFAWGRRLEQQRTEEERGGAFRDEPTAENLEESRCAGGIYILARGGKFSGAGGTVSVGVRGCERGLGFIESPNVLP